MIFVADKLIMQGKQGPIQFESEKWVFSMDGITTPRGVLSYEWITLKHDPDLSLVMKTYSDDLDFKDIFDTDDFEDEFGLWDEESYYSFSHKTVNAVYMATLKDKARIMVTLYNEEGEFFAVLFGHIEMEKSAITEIEGFANKLRELAPLSGVSFNE